MKCDLCEKKMAVVQEGAFACCLKCQAVLIERRLIIEKEREEQEKNMKGGNK